MGILDILEAVLAGPDQSSQSQSRSEREPASTRRRLPALDPIPDMDSGGGIGGAMRAVVQVVALKEGMMGGMSSAWTGSGTIVHPQGIILTNCHVANPRAMGMSSPHADRLAIAITERSDQAPAITYFADLVNYEASLDLAVLRIIADSRGRRVRNLNLPCVPIGDSDQLELGDKLAILGYPGNWWRDGDVHIGERLRIYFRKACAGSACMDQDGCNHLGWEQRRDRGE